MEDIQLRQIALEKAMFFSNRETTVDEMISMASKIYEWLTGEL